MFGMKNRVLKKQLSRAATIENCLKAGLFDHLMDVNGFDAERNPPSDQEAIGLGATVNWVLAGSIDAQLAKLSDGKAAADSIRTNAAEMLRRDENLHKLVVRLLYEIVSICMMLNKNKEAQAYLANHPRAIEVLEPARSANPELFEDVDERLFKEYFSKFISQYMPDMKTSTSRLFQ